MTPESFRVSLFYSMITSQDNNLIKKITKLASKKYRDEYNSFVIEGFRSVKDSLSLLDVEKIVLSESAELKYGAEFDNYEVVSDKIFTKICNTENAQGVIAVVSKTINNNIDSDYCLFLDRVRDPGNMGTILRTAVACGFNTVYCNDCVDVYNPKVVRSSMSAIAKLDIFSVNEDILDTLKTKGFAIVCAHMNGDDVFKSSVGFQKICLVAGNEANGVSDLVINKADKIVSLPMENIESLNVSVATAVIMYQLKYNK